MERRYICLLSLVIIVACTQTALSISDYLTSLQSVYGSGSCTTCHTSSGGGSRNSYGTLFENQPNHNTDPISALQIIGPPEGITPSPTQTPIPIQTPGITPSPKQIPGIITNTTIGGTNVACYVIKANGDIIGSTPGHTSIPTPVPTSVPTPGSTPTPTPGPGLNKVVQVYYDDLYSTSYTNIRYDLVTDILWAFIRINGDGSLDYTGYGDPSGLISLAHSNGVRVILSFQEVPGQANTMLGDPTARTNAINNLLNEVRTKGYDGVDNDIETSTYYQRTGMTLFMQELYNTFKQSNPDYRVSVAVSTTNWNNAFNGVVIRDYVDYLMIMAYDVYGVTESVSGPNAPILVDNPELDSVTRGIDYWKNTEGIPANKILLGIPYYGFDRPTSSNARLAYKDGAAQWVYIDNFPSYDHVRYFDNTWKTPWQVWQDGYQWRQLHYDDIESLTYKYDKANSEGLAGIGIWTINYGLNRADLWQLIQTKFV